MSATEAARLRELLRARSKQKAESTPIRFAYILDPELSARITVLGQQAAQLQDLVDSRRDALEQAEEAGAGDRRASGDDESPEARRLAAAEEELERVNGELQESIDRANADRFFIEFRPCGDRKYAEVFAAHPVDDGDVESSWAFQNALLEACFWRFTDGDGNPLPLFDSWAEFVAEAAPEFGEMDAWRTAVLVACRRNPHCLLPR